MNPLDDAIYLLRVENNQGRQEMLRITGKRDTVIEAALRVMLDCAPAFEPASSVPQFSVTVQAIK